MKQTPRLELVTSGKNSAVSQGTHGCNTPLRKMETPMSASETCLGSSLRWTSITDVTSPTGLCPSEGLGYGRKPWDVSQIKRLDPHESWLLMQGKSFSGRPDLTLDEAKVIFRHFDPATRQPL